jgi:hypothetical protein
LIWNSQTANLNEVLCILSLTEKQKYCTLIRRHRMELLIDRYGFLERAVNPIYFRV